MATFIRRGKSWQVRVCRKGRKASATFPTKLQAQEWASRIENDSIASHYGLQARHTLREAVEQFQLQCVPERQGSRWESLRLAAFLSRESLLCSRQLSSLSESDFSAWRDRRLGEVSPSTVRRELALLGAVLGIARREWKWLSHDPLKIKKPKEPPPRRRGVSHDEVIGILSHANDQVSCAFLLALETGMRAGEILSLTWGNVDLEKRVATLPHTKNGDSRQVPLSRVGVHILQFLKVPQFRIHVSSTRLRGFRVNSYWFASNPVEREDGRVMVHPTVRTEVHRETGRSGVADSRFPLATH